MTHFECDAFEDASWHIFMKQSEKHPKITHLLTQINRSAHWTHPAGCVMPHLCMYGMKCILMHCNRNQWWQIQDVGMSRAKLNKKAIGLMAQLMKLCQQHLSCLRRCFCFSS